MIQKQENITVVPYDSNWPNIFNIEAKKIQAALGNNCLKIYHIGSTAVPGLPAKPKIDIIACVKNLNFSYKGIESLNYQYRGGFNLPFRKSFTYRSDSLDVNLHVFEKDDPEVELNLLFRDYLRTHPKIRDQYAALKYSLIEEKSSHSKGEKMFRGYTLGKNDLIQDILKKLGFNRLRFVICTHHAELKAAKFFRKKYFSDKNRGKDFYAWTFNHKDHKHFILYKGIDISGYAHIQLFQENKVDIAIIIMDEIHQGKEYKKEFESLIEKWIQLENYTRF